MIKSENGYVLISEDLTELGGCMGTERTRDNWRKCFKELSKAQNYAEKDYGSQIEWVKSKKGIRSRDLGYVMYHIERIKFEK